MYKISTAYSPAKVLNIPKYNTYFPKTITFAIVPEDVPVLYSLCQGLTSNPERRKHFNYVMVIIGKYM